MSSLADGLGNELSQFFAPLVQAVSDPDWLAILLDALGSAAGNPAAAPLTAVAGAVSDVVQEISTLGAAPTPSLGEVGTLLESARKAIAAIEALETSGADPAAGLAGIGIDLIDLLAGAYVAGKSPLLYRLAALLTVVDAPQDIVPTAPVVDAGNVVRGPVSLPRFHPDRLVALIKDPVTYLKSFYLTPLATDADASAMADRLFPRVRDLLRTAGVMASYGVTPEELPLLLDGAPWVDHALTVWVAEEVAGATADAGASFALSPASRGDLGLVISPFASLGVTTTAGPWAIELDVTAEIEALAIGRRGMIFAASADTLSVDGKLSATLPAPDGGGPAYIFGTPTGTRLEVGGASFVTELGVEQKSFLWSVAADVASSQLVLAPGDGDSFLQSVLPPGGVKVPFALGLTWSNKAGLAFRGSGSLAAAIPTSIGIGNAVHVPVVYVGLQADETTGIAATLALALSVTLGPVTAVVDHVGLLTTVTFPPSGANLGVADFAVGFAPPQGMGIAVDAAVVTGGGYLSFDPSKGEYAGALDLSIAGIAVKAFGDLQTKLPSGPGYSFIAVISAEFLPAIELPFGFSLDGVGGLIGINRTISQEAVEAALWAHHLDGLLFPANPVASAPQLISALDTYFPAAPGRYVVGPLVKIGWSANLVVGELGVLFELPEPLKVLLIGDIQVNAPTVKPQLVLHISFDGGIDFGAKTAFFDATLHDSKITSYPISGDLAFRYGWGDNAVFALALGGFNPQFQPPAAFPTLKRLAISIGSSVAKLDAQAYLALTSNTLQFGARVELTAGTGGFNVHGWLGFDALFEKDPLSFEFDLTAGVDLRSGSDVLASVHLDGKLSGPTPWHISGQASLSLLFFDVSVHFDKTWGSVADPVALPDPLAALVAALGDRSAWGALPVPGVRAAISPAATPSDAGNAVLLDPAGALRIAQRAVPLDQPITRFSGISLGRTVSFSVDAPAAFGQPAPATTEEFAAAQFLDLSDAEKLSLPSFSRFDAGVELGAGAVDLGHSGRTRAVLTPIAYDTTVIDSLPPPPVSPTPPPYQLGLAAALALNNRVGRLAPGLGRYAPGPGAGPRVALAADQWVVASTADLGHRADIASDGTKLGAHLALQRYLSANPGEAGGLQIVLADEAG